MKEFRKLTFEQVPDALSQLIDEVASLKIILSKNNECLPKEEEEYLTPSEMAQSLKISMVTLWHWDNKAITRPLRVGNLKRYRRSDLEKIMVEFKNRR